MELPGTGPLPTDDAPDAPIGAGAQAAPTSAASAPPSVSVSSVSPDAALSATTPAFDDARDAAAPDGRDAGTPPAHTPAISFALASPAFIEGAPLPAAFTCRGADVSPPLTWSGAPAKTASFALVLTSRTRSAKAAAPQVEWVLWDIPATRSELPQGVSAGRQPSEVPGAQQHASGLGGALAGGADGVVPGWGLAPRVPVPGLFPVDLSAGSEALLLPRYRGPCGVDDLQYEFTLFALDEGAPPASSITLETVAESLLTGANVLARASLSASAP